MGNDSGSPEPNWEEFRRLMPVILVPTPPRYFAFPRWVTWLPMTGFFPHTSHCWAIARASKGENADDKDTNISVYSSARPLQGHHFHKKGRRAATTISGERASSLFPQGRQVTIQLLHTRKKTPITLGSLALRGNPRFTMLWVDEYGLCADRASPNAAHMQSVGTRGNNPRLTLISRDCK